MIVECPKTGAQKSVSDGIKRKGGDPEKPIAFCTACETKHKMTIVWTNEEIKE